MPPCQWSYFTTEGNPTIVYNFNDTLLDTSGNNHHLSLHTGQAAWTDVIPGMRAFYFDGETSLEADVPDLNTPGDLTVLLIVRAVDNAIASGGTRNIIGVGGANNANEVENAQWGLRQAATPGMEWVSESGSGIEATYFGPNGFPPQAATVLAVRRSGQLITFWANGTQFDATSGPLTTPTGGGDAILRIGNIFSGSSANFYRGAIAAVKAYNYARTDDDVVEESVTRFCPAEESPVPILFPQFDTIRGGKEIVVYSEALALSDTSEDAAFDSPVALPANWVATGMGTQSPTAGGVILETSAQPSTSSGLQSTLSHSHFDAAIDVEFIQPLAHRLGGVIDVAVFEFDAGSGTITIEVQRGPNALLQVRARGIAFGRTVVGHNAGIDRKSLTLRLVRNGARAWAFYGTRDPRTRVYSELVELLNFDQFVTAAGSLEVRADNAGARVDVHTRVSNFTVESHVRIGPRLLRNKRLIFRRVVGDVPPATLEEVGFADITAFGLFGEAVYVDGFEYTLPPPRTVGREQTRQLRFYADEQVRDGED